MPWLLTTILCAAPLACHPVQVEQPSRGACIRAELAIKREGGWAKCHLVKLPMAEME